MDDAIHLLNKRDLDEAETMWSKDGLAQGKDRMYDKYHNLEFLFSDQNLLFRNQFKKLLFRSRTTDLKVERTNEIVFSSGPSYSKNPNNYTVYAVDYILLV